MVHRWAGHRPTAAIQTETLSRRLIFILALAVPAPASAATLERSTTRLDPWTAVAERARHEMPRPEWTHILDAARGQSPALRLDAVNRMVNQVRYVPAPDPAPAFGDRWQTPADFFAHGGACRDYAVAKFFLLRALGIADDDLRIEVLRDGALWHAVLDVRVSGRWMMLDSRADRVMPRATATRYRAVYLMNEQAWWHWRDDAS